MSGKSISEVFDVEPYQAPLPSAPIVDPAGAIEHDAEYASDNIRKLIEIGMGAVEDAAHVARDSESPRAYEVVSTMIKNLTDMNLQLMDIHGKKQDLNRNTTGTNTPQPGASVTTNNAFFVGTTKELNDLIMKRMSGNGDIV